MKKSKLRIIAGEWKSRQIIFADTPGLRPTPAKVRETLFNWLQYDVAVDACLDLYAGSGALGFEAASRGTRSVVMVEQNAQACRLIKENAEKLDVELIKIVQQEVFKFLAGDPQPFNLVFLDPPFAKAMASQTCHWLEDKGWLAQNAIIYVEVESQLDMNDFPENWQLLKSKINGEVGSYLYQKI